MYDLKRVPSIASSMDDFIKDCAITVALKIADDSCKMDYYEKSVFMSLYDAIEDKTSSYFEETVFEVIKLARENPTAKAYSDVKKLRESTMEFITRPKMKAFKENFRKQLTN